MYLAAITNVFLSGLSSTQLARLLPAYDAVSPNICPADSSATKFGSGPATLAPGTAMTGTQMLMLFGIEHVLILLLLLIHLCIPDMPESVKVGIRKQRYESLQGESAERRRIRPWGSWGADAGGNEIPGVVPNVLEASNKGGVKPVDGELHVLRHRGRVAQPSGPTYPAVASG